MKINIFGVGRSGTKAIQLWLTYILLQQSKQAWVNYEPFCYRTKSLVPTQWGRLLHQSLPLMMCPGCTVSKSFEAFCHHLADHDMVVTKFIRGNGRINRINEIMQPDFSILVVRDLYQVLNSIALQNWNLVENKREWARISVIAKAQYPFLTEMGLTGTAGINKIAMSAVYWFVMNMTALENLNETFVIDFNQLESVATIPTQCGLQVKELPLLTTPLFHGNNIHQDYPLAARPADNLKGHRAARLDPLRNLLVKLSKRGERRGHKQDSGPSFIFPDFLIASEIIGSCCQLSESSSGPETPTQHPPKISVKVTPNSILNELSDRVSQALQRVIEAQSIASTLSEHQRLSWLAEEKK